MTEKTEKIDLTPYKLSRQGALIKEAEISAIYFFRYAELMKEAVLRAKSDREVNRAYNRVMMAARIRLIPAQAGEPAQSLRTDDIPLLPVKAANRLREAAAENTGAPGEIIQDGDGLAAPLIYRLGVPLSWSGRKVEELEFKANNYGQVEDVAAETFPFLRAKTLIENCALPVLPEGGPKLLRCPDEAGAKIELADGLFITGEILPRFLSDGFA